MEPLVQHLLYHILSRESKNLKYQEIFKKKKKCMNINIYFYACITDLAFLYLGQFPHRWRIPDKKKLRYEINCGIPENFLHFRPSSNGQITRSGHEVKPSPSEMTRKKKCAGQFYYLFRLCLILELLILFFALF